MTRDEWTDKAVDGLEKRVTHLENDVRSIAPVVTEVAAIHERVDDLEEGKTRTASSTRIEMLKVIGPIIIALIAAYAAIKTGTYPK